MLLSIGLGVGGGVDMHLIDGGVPCSLLARGVGGSSLLAGGGVGGCPAFYWLHCRKGERGGGLLGTFLVKWDVCWWLGEGRSTLRWLVRWIVGEGRRALFWLGREAWSQLSLTCWTNRVVLERGQFVFTRCCVSRTCAGQTG